VDGCEVLAVLGDPFLPFHGFLNDDQLGFGFLNGLGDPSLVGAQGFDVVGIVNEVFELLFGGSGLFVVLLRTLSSLEVAIGLHHAFAEIDFFAEAF